MGRTAKGEARRGVNRHIGDVRKIRRASIELDGSSPSASSEDPREIMESSDVENMSEDISLVEITEDDPYGENNGDGENKGEDINSVEITERRLYGEDDAINETINERRVNRKLVRPKWWKDYHM